MLKFLLLTFFNLSAMAQTPRVSYETTGLGSQALNIVNELLEQRITEVGELNLRQLKEEIQTVAWQDSANAPEACENILSLRRSACFNTEVKTVYITQRGQKEASQDLLQLHEALGALGYRDRNYSQSFSLDQLRRTENAERRQRLINSFGGKTFNKSNLKMQGGSSVGGGGDSEALQIKVALLRRIEREYVDLSEEFYTNYAEINIEPATQVNALSTVYGKLDLVRDFKNRYQIETAQTDRLFQELLSLYYPAHASTSFIFMDRVLREMQKIILSLYPANRQIPVKSFPGTLCFPTRIDYPEITFVEMGLLQRDRAQKIRSCDLRPTKASYYIMGQKWIFDPKED